MEPKLEISYIRQEEEFRAILGLYNNLLAWEFPKSQKKSLYFEWDALKYGFDKGRSFWDYIKKLSQISHDNYIFFIDLMICCSFKDLAVYKESFGCYPIIKIPTDFNETVLMKVLGQPFECVKGSYEAGITNTYGILSGNARWYVYSDYDNQYGKLVSSVGFPPQSNFPVILKENLCCYTEEVVQNNANKVNEWYIKKLQELNE